jgi:DNA sulfur modification protein DndD
VTEVRLLGWSAKGLRCPDHDISLERSAEKPYHVSLIQMPNGTGKTTTLELLRYAMSGPEAWGDRSALQEFAPRGSSGGRGQFDVRLLVDGRRYTIEMTLNFERQQDEYRTTLPNGSSVGFKKPPSLVRILTPDFVPFFVFDGELAHALLDPKRTRAREALEVQFQLTTLNGFRNKLDRYWELKSRNSTAKGDKGLTQRQNRLADLRLRRAQLVQGRKSLVKQIASVTERHAALDAQYRTRFDQDSQAQAGRVRLEGELGRAQGNLDSVLVAALGEVRMPQNLSPRFTLGVQMLRDSLDRLKLPESAAKEFFEELAHDEHCVCGEEMTEDRRIAILKRRDSYLGKEDMGILNSIKGSVKDLAGADASTYRAAYDKQLSRLRDAVRERDEFQGELDALKARRLEGGDAELTAMKATLDEFEAELGRATSRLEVLDADDDGEDSDSIKGLDKRIKKAADQVAEATQTRDIRLKTSLLKSLITAAVEDATNRIAGQLVDATNKRLEGILTRSPLRVSDVRDSVVLDGQSKGSPGQTLALGYAFLLGLFDAGQVSLPFIVDSPTGALDKNVRREIAGLLPDISKQLVAFTTSSEYEDFVPVLDQAAKGDIQYLTMFRLNEATKGLLSRVSASDLTQTSNGALVRSKDFFADFDDSAFGAGELKESA